VRHGLTGPGRIDPALPFRIAKLVRERRYEAIYFLDHAHAVFYGTLATMGTSVRARLMPVHTMRQWNNQPSLRRPIRIALPWLTRIISIAEIQRQYLMQEEHVPAHKLAMIHNGIPVGAPDLEERVRRRGEIRSEMEVPEGAPIIGITAVLRPEKNHPLLLQAFSQIHQSFESAELWIVGDGPERNRLEENVSRLGLQGSVRFLGHRADARRLMAGWDVAVLSSHIEALPLSLLEAMDAALPVVSTRVGALEEMVEEGRSGLLVSPGDPQALADGILTLLKDPPLRSRMGEHGQAICRRRFSVEGMVNQTADLLCELLRIPKGEWAASASDPR
jgi:glycosyltransferase involved in cell wall biosynthesis